MVITQLFETLLDAYRGEDTIDELRRRAEIYPELMRAFADWLSKYCEPKLNLFANTDERTVKCANRKVYGTLETEKQYIRAVLDYISGMSDNYCIRVFNELITY